MSGVEKKKGKHLVLHLVFSWHKHSRHHTCGCDHMVKWLMVTGYVAAYRLVLPVQTKLSEVVMVLGAFFMPIDPRGSNRPVLQVRHEGTGPAGQLCPMHILPR